MINCEQGLSYLAIYFNILGGLYIIKGYLCLAPIEIHKYVGKDEPIAHSLRDIINVVRQQVEVGIGIFFIITAALIQGYKLFFSTGLKDQIVPSGALISALIVMVALIVLSYFACYQIIMYKELKAKRSFVRKLLGKYPLIDGVDSPEQKCIISCAEAYFSILQKQDEPICEYLKRIYDFVGLIFPSDVSDYSNTIETKNTVLFRIKAYCRRIDNFVTEKRNFCSTIIVLIFTGVNALYVPLVDYHSGFVTNIYKDAIAASSTASNEADFQESFFWTQAILLKNSPQTDERDRAIEYLGRRHERAIKDSTINASYTKPRYDAEKAIILSKYGAGVILSSIAIASSASVLQSNMLVYSSFLTGCVGTGLTWNARQLSEQLFHKFIYELR